MGLFIHARRRIRGFLFRLWSTDSNAYVTTSVSEKELRVFLLHHYIKTLQGYVNGLDDRIAIAVEDGSDFLDEYDLNSSWVRKKQWCNNCEPVKPVERKRVKEFRTDCEKMLREVLSLVDSYKIKRK